MVTKKWMICLSQNFTTAKHNEIGEGTAGRCEDKEWQRRRRHSNDDDVHDDEEEDNDEVCVGG